ncbi:hypothetical protein ABH17_026945 (plasmid) [Bacillus toyonensis]|uniref:hypothetical protein n=1 Tax=Bacillus toyonensis TaxID=155322 RepID=UPI0006AA456E|nr:hypothetical protein [Bacillus toyonensis]OKO50959.1 hypothetical protein ABH17_026945 [Bacillus toyonensis]
MIFGDIGEAIQKMWELRGKPNVTASSITSLSYIFTILVAVYALIATIFFSYQVWMVSENNLKVSKQIQKLEINRDEEMVKENALIVYYDLQRGISNLRELYVNSLLKVSTPKPNRIYFSDDWIKNVANLRKELTNQELNKVYKLYEQFFTLQNILEEYKGNKQTGELNEYLEELSKEVFADFIPLPLLDKLEVSSIDELIGIDLYIILQKIYCLTFTPSKIEPEEKVVNGKVVYETCLNGVLMFVGDNKKAFEGNGELYTTKGQLKCSGQFQSNQFKSGVVYGYYNSESKCYQIKYETSLLVRRIKHGILYKLTAIEDNPYFYNGEFHEGELINGVTTIFNENMKIYYQGEIENGEITGYGITYSNKGYKTFEGILEDEMRVKGIGYIKGIEYFNGEYKNGNPWNGLVTKYSLSEEVKEFTGEICEGRPINGKGLYFKRNNHGEDLVALEERREFEEARYEIEDDYEYQQVMYEQQKDYQNAEIRRNYSKWVDYIQANWHEGNVTELEDKEVNIEVYTVEGSRIRD